MQMCTKTKWNVHCWLSVFCILLLSSTKRMRIQVLVSSQSRPGYVVYKSWKINKKKSKKLCILFWINEINVSCLKHKVKVCCNNKYEHAQIKKIYCVWRCMGLMMQNHNKQKLWKLKLCSESGSQSHYIRFCITTGCKPHQGTKCIPL
jgi:hypothetical protein